MLYNGKEMNLIQDFASLKGKQFAPSTWRVYLGAAKKGLKLVGKTPEDCGSYEELLALFREHQAKKKLPKTLRIAPFLGFLDSKIPKEKEIIPDYGPIRAWVIERIEKETKATRKALPFIRRDLAMLACLCAAPERGSPRRWPKTALIVAPKQQGGGLEIILWDKPIDTPGLTLALLYWHSWRARLDRPEQSRLHRKAWAYSDLLFPNSTGEVLGKQALHDALRRLGEQPAGTRLTPERIRQAFLQLGA
jgi:hypothetical protein